MRLKRAALLIATLVLAAGCASATQTTPNDAATNNASDDAAEPTAPTEDQPAAPVLQGDDRFVGFGPGSLESVASALLLQPVEIGPEFTVYESTIDDPSQPDIPECRDPNAQAVSGVYIVEIDDEFLIQRGVQITAGVFESPDTTRAEVLALNEQSQAECDRAVSDNMQQSSGVTITFDNDGVGEPAEAPTGVDVGAARRYSGDIAFGVSDQRELWLARIRLGEGRVGVNLAFDGIGEHDTEFVERVVDLVIDKLDTAEALLEDPPISDDAAQRARGAVLAPDGPPEWFNLQAPAFLFVGEDLGDPRCSSTIESVAHLRGPSWRTNPSQFGQSLLTQVASVYPSEDALVTDFADDEVPTQVEIDVCLGGAQFFPEPWEQISLEIRTDTSTGREIKQLDVNFELDLSGELVEGRMSVAATPVAETMISLVFVGFAEDAPDLVALADQAAQGAEATS